MNYSGYQLINETYNLKLRQDAQFAWINFTSMIMNISKTVSEVLYNKTLIVKKLSDLVEKTYDEYRNDSDKIEESAFFLYYDSKSPKTFCDLQENARVRNNATLADEVDEALTTSETTAYTTQPGYDEIEFANNNDQPESTKSGTVTLAAQEYIMQIGATTREQQLAEEQAPAKYQKEVFNFQEAQHEIRSVNAAESAGSDLEFDWAPASTTVRPPTPGKLKLERINKGIKNHHGKGLFTSNKWLANLLD